SSGIEPEVERRHHELADRAAAQSEDAELRGREIAAQEQDVEDASASIALDPLEGADELALHVCVAPEAVYEEPRRQNALRVHDPEGAPRRRDARQMSATFSRRPRSFAVVGPSLWVSTGARRHPFATAIPAGPPDGGRWMWVKTTSVDRAIVVAGGWSSTRERLSPRSSPASTCTEPHRGPIVRSG